jgi:hypothetical protein
MAPPRRREPSGELLRLAAAEVQSPESFGRALIGAAIEELAEQGQARMGREVEVDGTITVTPFTYLRRVCVTVCITIRGRRICGTVCVLAD